MTFIRFFGSSVTATVLQAVVLLYVAQALSVTGFAEFQLFLNLVVMVATLGSMKLEESLYRSDVQVTSFLFVYVFLSLFFAGIAVFYVKSSVDTYLFLQGMELVFIGTVFLQGAFLFLGHFFLSNKQFDLYVGLRLTSVFVLFVAFTMSHAYGMPEIISIPISLLLSVLFFSLFQSKKIALRLERNSIRLRSFITTNSDLLKINFPMSLVNIGMLFLLPIYISESYGLIWAGLFLFADKMTDVPVNVIGNSISKYVYAVCSKKRLDGLYPYVRKVVWVSFSAVWGVASIFVGVHYVGLEFRDELAELLGDWSGALEFLIVLIIAKLAKLSNMPTANVLTLVRKQKFSFWYMFVFFVIRLLVMLLSVDDFITFVFAWSAISVVYYLGHQFLVLGVLKRSVVH